MGSVFTDRKLSKFLSHGNRGQGGGGQAGVKENLQKQ